MTVGKLYSYPEPQFSFMFHGDSKIPTIYTVLTTKFK